MMVITYSFCSCSLKFSLSRGLTVKCIVFPFTFNVFSCVLECIVVVDDLRLRGSTGKLLVDMTSMILCNELTNKLVICSSDGITDNIPVTMHLFSQHIIIVYCTI